MLLSTINGAGRQSSGRRSSQARPGNTNAHEQAIEAIAKGEILTLDYQGNPRSIVPLVYGVLKNGKKAILCYKISHPESGMPELALRLYHFEKISFLERSGRSIDVNRKIDYYLTKHFATVYQKC